VFSEFCLRSASATLAAARLSGQVGVSEYGYGPADLAESVVQLATLVLTRQPGSALLHLMAEAVLKSVLRNSLTPRLRNA